MVMSENIAAFRGTMVISPINRPSFEIVANWVYKGDVDCWYGNGSSFPAEICRVKEAGEGYGVHVHSEE